MSPHEREAIDTIVRRTLVKAEVMTAVQAFFDGAPDPQLTQGDDDDDFT